MKKAKHWLRTLADLCPVDDRPRCLFCGKRLRPEVFHVWPTGKPGPEDLANLDTKKFGYAPERVLSIEYVDVMDTSAVAYWTGRFQGYGFAPPRQQPWFCTLRCGMRFGTAAAKAGYRMKGR